METIAALGVFGIVLIVIGLLFYFAPTIHAFRRGHRNKEAIFVLNFFLGWSLLGWVIALIWASTNDKKGN